ncbi:hypothetical protein [Lentzea sp. NBRC 102530]|uniref:hypothetical protein n=1 Tax=Lentzea sp. NBRC 102530 TaxID=3032201 RepID=UPI0024A43CEC|nr:hypothetical protein [Lentzea sp. NBRC 102530]GLY50083.1 hypothetical protein Lesp01_37390 [Lentzea sp. NBRC 102530]
MAQGSATRRVITPTIAMAVVLSGTAITINLATDWKTNLWAWLGVFALTAATAAVSYWLYKAQDQSQPPSVERSVTGDVSNSTVIIGDGNQVQR